MNQEKKSKIKINNPYKKFFQYGVWIILGILAVRGWLNSSFRADWEAYCPFGGLSALFRYTYAETLACSMTTVQIFMGLVFFIGVLLFAKLFCGYICPLGTFTEWMSRIGKRINMHWTITGVADKLLRSLKYGLLFITLYFSIKTGELFCKTYDPYFAIFDGFGHDVVVLYALIAIGLLVIGSIFFRMFFCKYLCPVGALSTIFTYFGMFGLAVILFAVLNIMGIGLSWVWLLAAVSILGYVTEVFGIDRKLFPVFAITRNDQFCKDCSLCDKACPHGIKITSYHHRVTDTDCTMCGDCLHACPRKDSIGINGRKRIKWLPALALAVLIALGYGLGKTVEIPTIDESWGTDEQLRRAEVYVESGVDRVTCFGSSRAFSNQMRQVDGILGVAAYVGTQTVRIQYDPRAINESGIRKAMFVPYHSYINRPGPEVTSISHVTLGIDDFMGRTDFANFGRLLSAHEGVYAFETLYGEPVITVVYFDPERFDPGLLPVIVETREVTYMRGEQEVTDRLNFDFDYVEEEIGTTTPLELEQRWFRSYSARFNQFDTRHPGEMAVYEVKMPQAKEPAMYRWKSYLMSHLSQSGGFVGLETMFTSEVPVAHITYLLEERSPEEVFSTITADSLQVRFADGRREKFANPWVFEKEGHPLE